MDILSLAGKVREYIDQRDGGGRQEVRDPFCLCLLFYRPLGKVRGKRLT